MASRMKMGRAALDRLLDPDNPSVTIGTLEKAAAEPRPAFYGADQ